MRPPPATACAGFWGKIPARGDFVGSGLPSDLVAAWDLWVSRGLAAVRAGLGDRFHPVWMEAPVWCFSIGPGLLGAAQVSGLWMPSVDRSGRYFPLMVAVCGAADPAWFAAAEQAGRAALREMLDQAALAARLPAAARPTAAIEGSDWWTEGAPQVAACRRHFAGLPGTGDFAIMLGETP